MPKKISLSKSLFMDGMRCPKMLWLKLNRPELAEPFDAPTLHLFDIGHQVEELARTSFPGVLIDRTDGSFSDLAQKTSALMSNTCFSIYEASFETVNGFCRADILQPALSKSRNNWILHEVKMSTKVKDEHYLDCGFQLYCIEKSGYDISQINLIHINSGYNRQGVINPLDLFKIEDITETVRETAKHIGKVINDLKHMCSSPEPPDTIPGSRCKNPGRCQFYTFCHKALPPGSIYEIPYGHTLIPILVQKGIQKIVDIPNSLIRSKRRMALVKSVKTGKPVIDRTTIQSLLKTIIFPVYFLDFETIAPCIPRFNETKPYEKLPFQYSLHKVGKPGSEATHFEYLHDSSSDPRIPLIKNLLCHIRKRGSIIAWNKSFEESVLKTIAIRYPVFSSQINAMLPRFVDLITPFRNGAYTDYRFRGSSSIKNVLPVLVPDLSYSGMTIKKGDEASLLFEKCVEGTLSEEEWSSYRKDLLNYCSLDTIAMVRIYEQLCKVV